MNALFSFRITRVSWTPLASQTISLLPPTFVIFFQFPLTNLMMILVDQDMRGCPFKSLTHWAFPMVIYSFQRASKHAPQSTSHPTAQLPTQSLKNILYLHRTLKVEILLLKLLNQYLYPERYLNLITVVLTNYYLNVQLSNQVTA